MEHEFWHERWERNEIGFHEGRANPFLRDFWPRLSATGKESVLVPLCGKAQDMWWLRERGHRVIGVELNENACRAFFEEAGREPAELAGERDPRFIRFGERELQLWCGDFFKLRLEDLRDIQLVYDRAALIALPPQMRSDYVSHLSGLLPAGARTLLITLDYETGKIKGPPFNVSDAEVERLYGPHHHIQHLFSSALGRDHPFIKRKGLADATESVFLLQKRPGAAPE